MTSNNEDPPLSLPPPLIIDIKQEADVIFARHQGRKIAKQLDFDDTEQVSIATVISEVAQNIVKYAQSGKIMFRAIQEGQQIGLEIIATDAGPGIQDIDLAMQNGYSTGNSLGLGLPGAKRMTHRFNIQSEVGVGTTITMVKWRETKRSP